MAQANEPKPKLESLQRHRLLHPRPDSVTDESFVDNDFFDPNDLLQVKYEMLRRVRVDKQPVATVARCFGFSRQAFYETQRAFERGGLSGLLPEKRGPRSAHKLSAPVVAFIEQQRETEPHVSADVLAQRVLQRFGVHIHPRSVQRALVHAGKKNV